MSFRSYRKESRDTDWGTSSGTDGTLSIEQINCGSLLRIADASEKMAQRHTELEKARDMYQQWWQRECQNRDCYKRQLSATKGVVTKLKKRIAALEGGAA